MRPSQLRIVCMWLAQLAIASKVVSTGPAHERCPKAVSIYAMQKTGSTFLGRFSRDVALKRKMCRVYQNNKEFMCESKLYVDCPRCSRHQKTVSLIQAFTTQLPANVKGKKCSNAQRQRLLNDANDWLRSKDVIVKYRYNQSINWLLSAEGFLRGPLRQLYSEYDLNAVPFYPEYHNVIMVHTRHPVEMMVSSYYCIADPNVCPVRTKFLGTHVPKNDTIRSVDEFVLAGIKRPGSTPYSIMTRNIAISRFIKEFHARVPVTADGRRCPGPTLLHSKYEAMVTNFSDWSHEVLDQMVDKSGRKSLHKALYAWDCTLSSRIERAP